MQLKNPLLQQTVQAVEAKVPPNLQNTYQRIVAAGEKFMYAPQNQQRLIKQLGSNPDPAVAAGEGIAKLFAILLHESKGTLNMQAASLAMTSLLCEALGFMEDVGKLQVDAQLLARATKEMGSAMMQVLGVTPDKLQNILAQRAGQAQQPAPQAGIVSGAQGA